jgi:hypothetical protein
MITYEVTRRNGDLPGMFGCALGVAPNASRPAAVQHQGMSVEQVHVCIDVHRDGDAITGTVTPGDGEARTFSGRLGLFSAIDDVIEGIGPRGTQGRSEDVDA